MSDRKRVRLSRKVVSIWKPEWEPKVKGWARKYIYTNKWRYESLHSVDDLMQDAYLVFLKVSDAYPRVVQPAHFMSLYKTSLTNALTDKAREYSRKLDLIDETVVVDDDSNPDLNQCKMISYNDGQFYALINNGPPELKMLLDFIKVDENLVKMRTPQREARGQPRMSFDQRMSNLLGIKTFPFRTTLKQLLGEPDVYT